MKKLFFAAVCVLLAAAAATSKDQLPADVKAASDRISAVTAEYYKSSAKAKNAKELAAAINKYAAEMEKLAPQIRALSEKYKSADIDPDNEDEDSSDVYYSMQEELDKNLYGDAFEENYTRIEKFYSDPEVRKAVERLNRVMDSISPEDPEAQPMDDYDSEFEEAED